MKRAKTFIEKESAIERKWFLIDAKGKTLGRLATVAADILRGKKKAFFSPHMDCGDFLVIINAKDVVTTGKKEEQKQYFTHSGYPRGDKLIGIAKMRATFPERIVFHAIKGMLPPNKLSDQVLKKLRVYGADAHPHSFQKFHTVKL